MKDRIAQAFQELNRFVAEAKQPAALEPGQEPIPLIAGSYNIDRSGERLFLEAWTRDRTLSRRITQVIDTKRHSCTFATERFGKKEGLLEVIDLGAPRSEQTARKASRHTFREQFRRSLLRQFPGWEVKEISAEADLENSLSPSYPRALLTKGAACYAAIGSPPQTADVDGVLTFGLIWLDYVRARQSKQRLVGLAVILPEGSHRNTCLRMLHLRADQVEWSAFVYADRIEDRVDLRDYGNITTTLPIRGTAVEGDREKWRIRLRAIPGVTEREEPGSVTSWTVNGMEFARWSPSKGATFGIDNKHRAQDFHASEIEALARELVRFRSASSADPANPLYSGKPELWLEAQVRAHIEEVDASLEPDVVYRQAPAILSGERSVLDLLAVDYAGRLAVVEVKASEDIQLPLQALDYWIRVRWHAARDDFRGSGYFPGRNLQAAPPRLILVSPALSLHPTTDALVHYFSPEVEVDTIGVAMNWRQELKVMFRKHRAPRPS